MQYATRDMYMIRLCLCAMRLYIQHTVYGLVMVVVVPGRWRFKFEIK